MDGRTQTDRQRLESAPGEKAMPGRRTAEAWRTRRARAAQALRAAGGIRGLERGTLEVLRGALGNARMLGLIAACPDGPPDTGGEPTPQGLLAEGLPAPVNRVAAGGPCGSPAARFDGVPLSGIFPARVPWAAGAGGDGDGDVGNASPTGGI